MELRARNTKRQETRREPRPSPPAAAVAEESKETGRVGAHYSITVRYSMLLYDTLHNMISSSHTAQDFTYTSPADFIRAALRAYKDGMALTELDQSGSKLETSLRVDQDLWRFYKSLPRQMRAKILERAIRTFMKQQAKAAGEDRGGGSRRKKGNG